MKKFKNDSEDHDGFFDFEKDAELFSKQLIVAIAKGNKNISLTFSGKSLFAFAQELAHFILYNASLEENRNDKSELLSKKEVMDLLGVSSTTLWNWCREKYLIPVKIGRKICYRKIDIEKLRKGE